MVTIVVAGAQATGKTSLALALGEALALPVFSRDPLMSAMLAGRPGWMRRAFRNHAAAAGLRIQTALLVRQLDLGQSAIIECVAPIAARDNWRRLTVAAGGHYVAVECVCSDQDVHRARVEARRAALGGRGIAWPTVQRTLGAYRPDPAVDFVADAVQPVADLAAAVLRIVAAG